jgi:ribonucleoside-diphosphate reductase alpha chain
MLDNVLTSFIDRAPEQLHKAKFSAMRERSLGLGAMGFHAYLQKNNIPFESAQATGTNLRMFSLIKEKAMETTRKLAVEKGACPDDDTCTVRNAHLLAIAPNASSSIICGNTSPSIEPFRANAFNQKTKSGSNLMKNKFLEDVLEQYESNTDEIWKSIVTQKGSVVGNFTASDADADSLTYSVAFPAVHGNISDPQRASRYILSSGNVFSIERPPQVRIAKRQMSTAPSMVVNCDA